MGLHNVDISAALRRLADKRIEDAIQEGKFDNLPGAGKPLNLDPIPTEENARLMWWALRILKNNNFTPEEIVDLTLLVSAINSWNRFAIAFRKLPV
jgi:hypothetical protein